MKNCELARLVYGVLKPKEPKIPKSFIDEVEDSMALDLKDTLYNYTDGQYGAINKALYAGGKLEDIDSEMAHIFKHEGDYHGTVYRHTYIDPKWAGRIAKLAEDKYQSQYIHSDIIMSTSKEKGVLGYYEMANTRGSKITDDNLELHLTIEVPEHQKQYDIAEYSRYADEEEVLIEPHTTFAIQEVVQGEGYMELKLSVVRDDTIRDLNKYIQDATGKPNKHHFWKGLMSMGAIAPAMIDTKKEK